MKNKVRDFIIENELIEKGDKILVALSGGPDSVCLLNVLYSLKEDLDITIGAAHVNHMLRGDEAVGDEEYAKSLCERLSIEFFVKKIDIDKISKERNISHEMAGREERYKFFETIKNNNGYNKIAVAHNANDQVETILMNMMRGTGIEGLCGIRSKREGGVIRPILCLSREEVELYCSSNNLEPRIDKSNLENVYSRNKVRLDIIPYMKDNFNKDIINTINRMSSLIQVDNDFLEKEAIDNYNKYCSTSNNALIISKKAFLLDRAIISRVVKKAFFEFTGKYNNFEMKHIYDVIELSKNTTNKRIYLTNNILAENIYGDIYLKFKDNIIREYKEVVLNKDELDNTYTCYENYNVSFEVIKNKNNIDFSKNVLIKYFDYDKIEKRLVIRKRRNGDKMLPLGMKGSKKVKDIFMDLKIPVDKRDEVPVLCFDNEIAWLVEHKVSEKFKITKETKNIIKITFARKG
ncbi:tRNA lysidine(34) synthetase TilS [Clostridium tertium]|uniref:tRNA(Ile)-lysidine synthase n=1 Tax=Clostridium tertium TaxID=1559 RepID=A0A6N3B1N2_9CLOT